MKKDTKILPAKAAVPKKRTSKTTGLFASNATERKSEKKIDAQTIDIENAKDSSATGIAKPAKNTASQSKSVEKRVVLDTDPSIVSIGSVLDATTEHKVDAKTLDGQRNANKKTNPSTPNSKAKPSGGSPDKGRKK